MHYSDLNLGNNMIPKLMAISKRWNKEYWNGKQKTKMSNDTGE